MFQAQGLLSKSNELNTGHLSRICRQEYSLYMQPWAQTPSPCHFDPHYEIYSDASRCGFGAYLLKKDDQRVHWLANLWSEHFPRGPFLYLCHVTEHGNTVVLDSFFGEFYSVVSAFYTWKHCFVEKRVLVWTDNASVVKVINQGCQGQRNLKRVEKLHRIMAATCDKYHITVAARHVHRTHNTAADFLSRSDLAAFRAMLPQASPSMKKTKKLLFWNPVQATVVRTHGCHKPL
jgi:hypothetical protein